jgi:hypothetical protein
VNINGFICIKDDDKGLRVPQRGADVNWYCKQGRDARNCWKRGMGSKGCVIHAQIVVEMIARIDVPRKGLRKYLIQTYLSH